MPTLRSRLLSLVKAPLWGLLFIIFLPTIGIAMVGYLVADSLYLWMERLYADHNR